MKRSRNGAHPTARGIKRSRKSRIISRRPTVKFGGPTRVLVPYANGHCPDVVRVALAYTATITASSITSEYYHTFNGNSCFDPDQTGVGSQPVGFDQWMAFYTNYKVFASKIEVAAVNMGSTEAVRILLLPSNSSDSDITTLTEESLESQPYVKGTQMIPPKTDPVRISSYMTTSKIKGYDGVLSESGFGGSASANPVNRWYWHINCHNVDDTGTVATVYMDVKVTYYVEFYKKKALALS